MADTRRYQDRAQYITRKVIERRKRLKHLAVRYKGGKCSYCGYNRCVEALGMGQLPSRNSRWFTAAPGGNIRE